MNFFISASLAFFVLSIYTAHYIVELHKTTKDSAERDFVSKTSLYVSIEEEEDVSYSPLQQDYYRDSCPSAERINRKALKEIYKARPSIAPSLIRLLFHDCFIEVRFCKTANGFLFMDCCLRICLNLDTIDSIEVRFCEMIRLRSDYVKWFDWGQILNSFLEVLAGMRCLGTSRRRWISDFGERSAS